MQSADEPAPVALQLATPGPWLPVDLDPRTRSGSLARLVTDRLGTDPAQETARRELTATLRGFARDAAAAGAVHAALLIEVIDGTPVQLSMIASYAALPAGKEPAAALAVPGSRLSPHPLRLGPAQRVVSDTTTDIGGEATPTLLVQYAVPVPGRQSALILSFSSPQVANSAALLDLFNAIAADARWVTG